MNITVCIDAYVKGVRTGSPVFTEDIYAYVARHIPGARRDVVNTYIARYAAKADLVRYRKGIYYKAAVTPFGATGISYAELLKRRYLTDGDKVFGYETGPSYMNKIGLTTQMSGSTFIATDKAGGGTEPGVVLVRPVLPVDNDNYRYLQFLDMLDNRMKVRIEAADRKKILRGYIDAHGLDFEKLMYYARYYKNSRIYGRIAELAREA